jgi:transcription elongation GreA/GreB family factor
VANAPYQRSRKLEQPDQYRATMIIAAIRNTAINERARSKALDRGSGLDAPSGGMKQIPCTHLLSGPAFFAKINPALSTVETTRTNPSAEFNWTPRSKTNATTQKLFRSRGEIPGRARIFMSRAFVREKDVHYLQGLPGRPISEHPNDVTETGLTQIEHALAAQASIDRAALAAAGRDLRYWTSRRAAARVVSQATDRSEVRFGTAVTIMRDDGREQTFRIVGEDEADPAQGSISHLSPLAKAMFGKRVGDVVRAGAGEAKILQIQWPYFSKAPVSRNSRLRRTAGTSLCAASFVGWPIQTSLLQKSLSWWTNLRRHAARSGPPS